MTKVGLITYHKTTNFGSLLQTYALYKTINDLGYNCEVIDYRNTNVEAREHTKKLLDCRSLRELYRCVFKDKNRRKKEKEFAHFINSEINVSSTIYNRENIEDASAEYDVFVVGSDLVWDFSINKTDTTYMLDFVEDSKRKIAYASSTGGLWENRELVVKYLSRLKHIGVREAQIKDELSIWLNTEVDFVCDPTMLVPPSDWEKMVTKRKIDEKYVVCYFYDKNRKIYDDALKYGREHGLPVYVITTGKAPAGCKSVCPFSLSDFLTVIYYADAVFTASYHGMLFSLYFKKNLFFFNRGYKSRMQSLAKLLNIESREEYKNDVAIDYVSVDEKMNRFRKESLETLRRYLID